MLNDSISSENLGQFTNSINQSIISNMLEDSITIGSSNSSITFIVFSDFQCPYSGIFFSTIFAQLLNDFVKTGDLNFVFKHLPILGLGIHDGSYEASNAAECALEQNKFWEYNDILWRTQNHWSGLNLDKSLDQFSVYAKNLRLNQFDFDFCLYSTKHSDKISKDLYDGLANGISVTPTVILYNNHNAKYDAIIGIVTYNELKDRINKLINDTE